MSCGAHSEYELVCHFNCLEMERKCVFIIYLWIYSSIYGFYLFLCDFSKASTHTVQEARMRCKANALNFCAHTIRSDCRVRFIRVKYSGCASQTMTPYMDDSQR